MARFNRHLFIILGLLSVLSVCPAQSKKSSCPGHQDTVLHKFVNTFGEKLPEPKDGLDQLLRLIGKSDFKCPKCDADSYGRVVVAFVVEANGKIDGGRIINDQSGSKRILGRQILDIIKKAKWTPGLCNKKRVAILYTLPLNIEP